jgi:hypothetical protein
MNLKFHRNLIIRTTLHRKLPRKYAIPVVSVVLSLYDEFLEGLYLTVLVKSQTAATKAAMCIERFSVSSEPGNMTYTLKEF